MVFSAPYGVLWSNVVCTMYYVLLHKHSTWCRIYRVLFTVCNRAIVFILDRKSVCLLKIGTERVKLTVTVYCTWHYSLIFSVVFFITGILFRRKIIVEFRMPTWWSNGLKSRNETGAIFRVFRSIKNIIVKCWSKS